MLTITRIVILEYSSRQDKIPLKGWYHNHAFDFAIGASYPNLGTALESLKPALASLHDLEVAHVYYIINDHEDHIALFPRDYTPFAQGAPDETLTSDRP